MRDRSWSPIFDPGFLILLIPHSSPNLCVSAHVGHGLIRKRIEEGFGVVTLSNGGGKMILKKIPKLLSVGALPAAPTFVELS